jgi:hypothetical protein
MNPTSPIFFITRVLIARLHHQDVIALGVTPTSPSSTFAGRFETRRTTSRDGG